ncbi:MAG: DUF1573 domain-containing protein [Chlorobi bacterium]|nr:DUF1573 domain-containing protein [Chlorobiota bacterium]
MKKFLLFALALSLTFACNNDPSKKIKKENLKQAQQELAKQNKFPVMSFDYEEVDFGHHKEGEILDTVFRFKNTGNATLIISKVRTSCGCTTPYWPRNPIKPGDSGVIKVSFNTNHKTGHQVKTITIHANEKKPTHVLRIKAEVEPKPRKNNASNNKQSNAKVPPIKKLEFLKHPKKNI